MTHQEKTTNSFKTKPKSSMLYCGAHYSKCPVEIRELWAQGYALDQGPQELKKLIEHLLAGCETELVVVSTCNRFDLCVFGSINNDRINDVFIHFAEWTLKLLPHLNSPLRLNKKWHEELSQWIRIFTGEQALLHLFRVASSLDSLVLGEPHILGQLKDAYHSAVKNELCGKESASAFNKTFQAAKRVRHETDLGRNAVSIGHAAGEIIQRVFEDLTNQKCLILGAGEMARVTAQHLRSCGGESITFANRTIEKAAQLAEKIGRCSYVQLDSIFTQLHDFDIIVTATASQEFVLKKEHASILMRRKSGLPCVIVDISVPRNVDPELGKLKNLFHFDIDDLDKVMETSRQARQTAAQRAELIIQQELAEFKSDRRQRENLARVGKFHSWVRDVAQREIQKSLKNGRTFDTEQINITADAIAKKLVAHPAILARSDYRLEGDSESIGSVMKLLFNLTEGE